MKLLTKSLEVAFRMKGNQDGKKDPIVIAKYFFPAGGATWFATEYFPEDRVFFGFVTLSGLKDDHNNEWGYFSLDEFETTTVRGLKVERDSSFRATPISKVWPEAVLS